MFTSASSDHTIHVCSLGATAPLCSLVGHSDEVNSVRWSPGAGRLLASGGDDSAVKLWTAASASTPTAAPALDLIGHTKEVCVVRWAPTGEGSANPGKQLLLASASFDSTVLAWLSFFADVVKVHGC
jgi:transducin (beta)-like 1